MTTMMIDAATPGGNPLKHRTVVVRLIDGGAGASNGSRVILDTWRVRLDDTGHASIDLDPNDTLTPQGTFYRFAVEGASPTISREIELLSSTPDPVSWAEPSIQVLSPVPPTFEQQVGPQGPPGDVLLIDGGNASSFLPPLLALDGGSA